jgi:hypothetical protein
LSAKALGRAKAASSGRWVGFMFGSISGVLCGLLRIQSASDCRRIDLHARPKLSGFFVRY